MATTLDPQQATQPPAAPTPEVSTSSTEPSAATLPATKGIESPAQATSTETLSKPIHSLVLDAGPLIKNDPPVSTLLAQAHELYTIPSVIETEIRDAATRARVQTTLVPFLKLREPKPESVRFVRDFARRTGDLDVLSRPDIALMALAYELECERNGGDWRLRRTPGQKGVNGRAPGKAEKPTDSENSIEGASLEAQSQDQALEKSQSQAEPVIQHEEVSHQLESLSLEGPKPTTQDSVSEDPIPTTEITPSTEESPVTESKQEIAEVEEEEEDDDEEGWITPSNLKKHQEQDQALPPQQPNQRFLQVALLTSDYAMQNVLLRMNLNLVSPALARITRVKTWVMRCHGCFQVARDTSKQFCPRCGQPTLTRVSASTDQATGAFTLHLKRHFQWNNRGNVYSVPKPVHGSANGRLHPDAGRHAGGKNGWGRELILAEDQKEYVQKRDEQRRQRTSSARDRMDEDYLPGILSGDRKGAGSGRIKVGAGRSVNARKRR